VVGAVFVVALSLRIVYLLQLRDAPYFDAPLGDSLIYYDRARQILAGGWVGDEIYFHSSPPYPYLIAFVMWLSRGSFLALGVVQALVGAGNCVLVYLLARRLGGRAAAIVAGFTAALYGLFAFFDADLLMIFLTLFLVDGALLLLLRADGSDQARWPLLAGVSLGLAALDKTNLLLFGPVAFWWLAGSYSLRLRSWRWRPALLFTAGVALTVLPFTARNYLVGHDLVLVSSNAGVNLFIGNNPEANATFHLPEGAGLTNTDLYGSSVRTAEAALGRTLKPSEVSQFWARKAEHFWAERPLQAMKLLGWKVALLLNAYETPNHLDFYYVRDRYAPVLRLMWAGFWLVTPLALVAIGLGLRRGLGRAGGLYLGFLVTYAASLLPFFISERYRLPMVPVFIAFASALVVHLVERARARSWGELTAAAAGLAVAAVVVNWPLSTRFNFLSFDHEVIAAKYLERARPDPAAHARDVAEAIRELKQVVEVTPDSTVAHVNLGTALEMAGYYSGSIEEYETALKLDPRLGNVRAAEDQARAELAQVGDRVRADAVPASPYEEAEAAEASGQHDRAVHLYTEIVEREPFHYNAVSSLAGIAVRDGDLRRAERLFEGALERQPSNFALLYNLAYVDAQLGRTADARALWTRCLALQPGNAMVEQQLRALPPAR
jgi:tetratricopeptide (TPR) repeat protein